MPPYLFYNGIVKLSSTGNKLNLMKITIYARGSQKENERIIENKVR